MDDFDITALKARLEKAAASGWGMPSPSAARQEAEALRRWRAEHPEPERKVEIEDTEEKPERRERRPSVAALIKRAEKSGKAVASITLPDGTTLRFGERDANDSVADELNEWRRRRARHS
jgi:hypothetical protein